MDQTEQSHTGLGTERECGYVARIVYECSNDGADKASYQISNDRKLGQNNLTSSPQPKCRRRYEKIS